MYRNISMNTSNIIENTILMERMDYALSSYKILFINGPLGSGKTTSVSYWLNMSPRQYEYIAIKEQASFQSMLKELTIKPHTIYIFDDLHLLGVNSESMLLLGDKITKSPVSSIFILTSRGNLPSIFKVFAVSGQLVELSLHDNGFTKEMISALFIQKGLEPDSDIIARVLRRTKGHALHLRLIVDFFLKRNMEEAEIYVQAETDLFDYFDAVLLPLLTPESRKFIWQIASLETVNIDLVEALGISDHVKEMVDYLVAVSSFLVPISVNEYTFTPIISRYLLMKQQKMLSLTEICTINSNIGKNYEEQNDIYHAVYYQDLAHNYEKVAELLEYNAKNNHVGVTDYVALEEYYLRLPKERVLNSPALLSGMAMLHSLCGRIEESEDYYLICENAVKNTPKNSDLYYEYMRYSTYLDMALPHHGNINIVKYIMKASSLMGKANKSAEFKMQPMSITGNMPSLMNGGKDFCSWTKHDTSLYNLLGPTVETVMGYYGQGLSDIGMGESLYYKNKLTESMVKLSAGISKANVSGSIEMHFAGQGLLAKVMTARGEVTDAIELVAHIRSRAVREKATYLLPNIDALRMHLQLYANKTSDCLHWLVTDAPNAYEYYYITKRYEYMLKIRLLILAEKYEQAFLLMHRVAQTYFRKYIEMEVHLLKAIILYRMKDDSYKEIFLDVVNKAQSYHFVRLIADEGAAVWDMVSELKPSNAFRKELITATQKQATLYPNYLVSANSTYINLTEQELTILNLLCSGITNEEMAQVLFVTTHTIKFHLRNIYKKLAVDNRSMAIRVAIEKGIVIP